MPHSLRSEFTFRLSGENALKTSNTVLLGKSCYVFQWVNYRLKIKWNQFTGVFCSEIFYMKGTIEETMFIVCTVCSGWLRSGHSKMFKTQLGNERLEWGFRRRASCSLFGLWLPDQTRGGMISQFAVYYFCQTIGMKCSEQSLSDRFCWTKPHYT